MKVLQWNIWYKEDIKNIISTIKNINPDIICLQELTINHPHYNQGANVPELIARDLGFNFFYKEAQKNLSEGKERSYGNGIFSRYPIVDSRFLYIQVQQDQENKTPDYSKEGRVYIECKIDVSGEIYTVATTHMSYTDRFVQTEEKHAEADKLLSVVKENKSKYILTGDFNSLPGSYTVDKVHGLLKNAGPSFDQKTWTTKPFSYNGFEADTLAWRIDYCFVSQEINCASSQIINTSFSDHLPILIEV